ncbi:hypothetical protein B0H17DRAFT_1149758 [Mycena rosella]|uniref:Uncharacterized protein n=1 Tax=Mycena rosella TaxID=1033263 RepID=A0AAD7FQT6_MYCRO|nr:hypothetical protein B0H17DRAFT_1149758 [Mycena rosella]
MGKGRSLIVAGRCCSTNSKTGAVPAHGAFSSALETPSRGAQPARTRGCLPVAVRETGFKPDIRKIQEREHADPFLAPYATPPQHSQRYSPYSDQPGALLAPQHPYGGGGAYGTNSQLGDAYRHDPVYPPAGASPNNSALLLHTGASAENAALSRSYGPSYVPGAGGATASRRKRRWIGLGVVVGIIAIAVAVMLPVYFLVIKKHNDTSASGTASGGSGAGGSKGVRAGAWNAANPFGSGGRPNSWTLPLNESWDWAADKIYGVNLGGWFVLKPFYERVVAGADAGVGYTGGLAAWGLHAFGGRGQVSLAASMSLSWVGEDWDSRREDADGSLECRGGPVCYGLAFAFAGDRAALARFRRRCLCCPAHTPFVFLSTALVTFPPFLLPQELRRVRIWVWVSALNRRSAANSDSRAVFGVPNDGQARVPHPVENSSEASRAVEPFCIFHRMRYKLGRQLQICKMEQNESKPEGLIRREPSKNSSAAWRFNAGFSHCGDKS